MSRRFEPGRVRRCGERQRLARTERLPRMVTGANITPGFFGRFYYPGDDPRLYEITVLADG